MKKKLIWIFMALAIMLSASAYMRAPEREWTDRQYQLHEIANQARTLGLPEDSPIVVEAQRLWWSEQRDLQILANVILNEAPHCTDRHQQLVAQVVLNRVASPLEYFPDTVEAVVNEPGQYDPDYTLDLPELTDQDEEVKRAFRNARTAMDGLVDCPADVLYQSEFSYLGSGSYEIITVDTGWYRSTTYFNFG